MKYLIYENCIWKSLKLILEFSIFPKRISDYNSVSKNQVFQLNTCLSERCVTVLKCVLLQL